MAKIINLINSIDQTTHDYDEFIINLLSIHSDLPSDNDEIEKLMNLIISVVNSRLNEAITRYDGLNILLKILPRCSKELLIKYSSLWISKAVQTLENSQSDKAELTLACQVLGKLIILCKEISDLQKQISMQTLKQLINIISNMNQIKLCGGVYYLLATLMYHYKESSEKFQISLRKLILLTIDAKDRNLVQAGANCFTLLARATERSFKPLSIKPMYTSWIYNQYLICNSLHAIMDELFSDIMEIENIDVGIKLELTKISDANFFDYYNKLARRFENLCLFLSTMLRGCGERNSVCSSDILKVLCRGLAITPLILKSDTFKHQMLSFILPKLHINLFMILNGFIVGFRQELLPYANIILKLYSQSLKWTDNNLIQQNTVTIDGCKPFKSLKKIIYQSLSLWLTNLGYLSAIEIAADEIIPHLLKEITPDKNRVLLTVEKTHNLSKRALKRFKDSQYENSAVLGSVDASVEKKITVNADLCQVALVTLENILHNSASFVKLPLYKSVQKLIVSLLYDTYLATDETGFYRKNHSCRHNLLKVLRAIQLNPQPSLPPPTQYSIEIFTLAMNDSQIEIIKDAKLSLVEIEKIVHPCAATLEFPLLNDELEKNNQEIELNRINDIILNNDKENQSIDTNENDINMMTTVVESDQIKNNESINDIDDKNCNGPKPNKLRKLENINISNNILSVCENNSDKLSSIVDKNITINSQNEQSVVQDSIDKSLIHDNSNDLVTSVKIIDKNSQIKSIEENKGMEELMNDSEEEEILSKFCNELNEDYCSN